jgi:polysaccharide export outer membrane protein
MFMVEKVKRFFLFSIAVATILCNGCLTDRALAAGQSAATTSVVLSAGDTLKFTFPGAPELDQTQKIKTDGKVNLPFVGEVTAAGKTLLDFQNELIKRYKSQLRNNDVFVTIESGTLNVVVSGSINRPGRYTFDRPTTVFQAIMEAGGVNEFGNLGKVRLIRTENGKQRSRVLNLKQVITKDVANADYVKDGDVIYVPQSLF